VGEGFWVGPLFYFIVSGWVGSGVGLGVSSEFSFGGHRVGLDLPFPASPPPNNRWDASHFWATV